MSEEKKTSWGKGYEPSVAQEPKHAVPPVGEIDAEPTVAVAPASASGGDASDRSARARHQHVLPGILGKQLRAAYGELLNTPVPDTIGDLVKKLKQQETDSTAASKPREGEGDK